MVERTWRERIGCTPCPACSASGQLVRHGVYEKYLYFACIPILRVRCRSCRCTHAVIPSFSLPGTSLGTVAVEVFIADRGAGCSRRVAGSLLIERGVSEGYLRRIEKLIRTAIHRAKALFGALASQIGEPYRWLREVTAGDLHPVRTLNQRSIFLGYGAIFCSLAGGAGGECTVRAFDFHTIMPLPPVLLRFYTPGNPITIQEERTE
jgi:hypothetical protein